MKVIFYQNIKIKIKIKNTRRGRWGHPNINPVHILKCTNKSKRLRNGCFYFLRQKMIGKGDQL
jgi:hypothetical protein